MRRRALLLCCALVAAACQTDQVSAPPQVTANVPLAQTSVVPANCPPRGLVLRTSDGRELSFLGRDPNDPEVCQWI